MEISASEQEQVLRSLRRLVQDRKAARAATDDGKALDSYIWRGLIDMGLIGSPLPESLGGSSLALNEQAQIVEILAYMVAPVPAMSALLAAQVLSSPKGDGAAFAELLATGKKIIGTCFSAEAGLPLGLKISHNGHSAQLSGTINDVVDGATLEMFLVPAKGQWWAVDASAQGVTRKPLRTLDGTRPLATLTLENAIVTLASDADPQTILAAAWVLMAAESVGVAQAALDLAAKYSLDRTQFGEQIGRFQAIKIKLADSLVALEGARSAVGGAAKTAVAGGLDVRAARMAKVLGAKAGVQVVGEAIQIHGAIGCTWEHDLHLLLRRAKFSELALGSGDQHLQQIASDLFDGPTTEPRGKSSPGSGDLTLDTKARAFLDELRTWLDEHATPQRMGEVRRRDISVLRGWQAEMADAGWAGIHWPKQFGGREASFTQQVLYHSELATRDIPPFVGNRGLSLVGPTLIVHGTPQQQELLLEPSRRAQALWASGLSEPAVGSDLASLRTRGTIEGSEIVVNGQKTWTSGAHYSEWLYTLIRTGPLVPKHSGISCVLIPLNSPGVAIRPIRRMNGVPEFNEVFLDDVRVPMTNLVGKVNEGWKVARTTLAHEHLTNFLGAQLRQSQFVDRIITKLRERESGGMSVDYGLRARIAQSWINTQLLRLHGLRNMSQITEGKTPGAEGSILKLFGQEEERRVYELALDVRGAEGLTSDRPSRAYLGARAATIGGGTSEIHRNKIAERVLGMPRDIWADDWN